MARGSEAPKFNDAEQLLDENMEGLEEKKADDDDDEDDEEGSADVLMDIDGKRKKILTEYEGESQSEEGSEVQQTGLITEQADMIEMPEEKQDQQTVRTDTNKLKKIDREKYSKYL